MGLPGHLASDGPDETRQIPGHGSANPTGRPAGPEKVTTTSSSVKSPGNLPRECPAIVTRSFWHTGVFPASLTGGTQVFSHSALRYAK